MLLLSKMEFFLFLPIIIRRHTADFLAREFDFLFRRGEQICKFPTLYVGMQSNCISVMWWAISISAIHNIHSCAGIIVCVSKNQFKLYEPAKYTFKAIFLPLLLNATKIVVKSTRNCTSYSVSYKSQPQGFIRKTSV